jgi:two-component system, chemotaxis family, sensor kinase Cph1
MGWLFNTNDFVTRDHCGQWSTLLILVYQLANFMVFLAYIMIPISLFSLWLSARGEAKERLRAVACRPCILILFAIFIFSCGCTHLMDVLAFSWPAYRFYTVVDIVTAVTSLATSFLLPGVIRQLLTGGGRE